MSRSDDDSPAGRRRGRRYDPRPGSPRTLVACLLLALWPGAAARSQSPQAPAKATPQSPNPSPPAFWPPAAPVPVPAPTPPAAPRQPPRDFATPPAPDAAPPPAPPAPPRVDLGDAEETEVKYTKTTRRGGIIINNDAPHASNTLYVGNSGWGAAGTPNPPAAPRQPSRDFAQPPTDAPPGPGASSVAYSERTVDIAQAQRLDLSRPWVGRRLAYALAPGHRHLATPRAVVPATLSISLPPPPPPAPRDAAPAGVTPPAPSKHCLAEKFGWGR